MKSESAILKAPAEELWARELAALRAIDQNPRPPGWLISPRAVREFILGSEGRALAHQWREGWKIRSLAGSFTETIL